MSELQASDDDDDDDDGQQRQEHQQQIHAPKQVSNQDLAASVGSKRACKTLVCVTGNNMVQWHAVACSDSKSSSHCAVAVRTKECMNLEGNEH